MDNSVHKTRANLMSGDNQSSLSVHKGSYKTKGTTMPRGLLSSHPNHKTKVSLLQTAMTSTPGGTTKGRATTTARLPLSQRMRAADCYAAQLKEGLALLTH